MVTILIFGHYLRSIVDEPELELEVPEPTTVRLLMESHPDTFKGLVGLLKKGEILVTVNRKVAALDSQVKDGDTIKLTHNVTHAYEGAMWHNP